MPFCLAEGNERTLKCSLLLSEDTPSIPPMFSNYILYLYTVTVNSTLVVGIQVLNSDEIHKIQPSGFGAFFMQEDNGACVEVKVKTSSING